MNSEHASNDIRQSIDEAIGRYYSNPILKGATHTDLTGRFFKRKYGIWYQLSPFAGWVKLQEQETIFCRLREL